VSIRQLEHSLYLVVRKSGRRWDGLSVRVADKQPTLQPGEVATRQTLSVPSTLFEWPQLKASLTIPADKVAPAEITADVIDNIADAIRQAGGVDVKVTVGEREEGR
jgi:hypothetical protein